MHLLAKIAVLMMNLAKTLLSIFILYCVLHIKFYNKYYSPDLNSYSEGNNSQGLFSR